MQFEKSKLQWIEYDLLKDHPVIDAKTYLRHGGSSENKFFSLNLSKQVGDSPDSVKMNRARIKEDIQAKNLVFANQIHSNYVVEITKDNIDKLFDCDAFVTKEKDIALAITHADCQAALFFDPENEIIAAVHAGYRGLIKNIYQKTIDFMKDRFNSKPQDILACISASLCPKHAEFKNYKKEFPENFWSYKKDDYHFDLWQIAQDQLKQAGLDDKNIELANECTYCNEKDYFSFRKDNKTGRNATVICLKK
ncbi:MAG: Laccase domain protein YfiH [Candidatus Anoxychlamydiales bacterium]|nr:Laccase domain protein YfiH [Candidatus Anoxychlamydiales bacterium]